MITCLMRVLTVNVGKLSERVIDPTVIVRSIHSIPAQRWKLFLAVASGLENQSRSNPTSILANHWSRERIANSGINRDLPENNHVSHSLASVVHLSDRRPHRGRAGGG